MVKDLTAVAEKFRDLYKKDEDSGEFVLHDIEIDDSGVKDKLDEFRANNRKLFNEQKELKEQLDKFRGVDPAKYAEAMKAMEAIDKLEDAKLLKEGKVDELLKRRTDAMRTESENRIKALMSDVEKARTNELKYRGQLHNILLENEVTRAIMAIGTPRKGGANGQAGALFDIINRARSTFQLDEEGKLVPKNAKGETVFGAKGEPMTLDEWGRSLLKDAPYLFEASQGSGATGGGKKETHEGKIIVDGSDPLAVGKFAKEIADGRAIVTPAPAVV